VPKILLGLGATCLLVAAVIFLAVAWSWLGVGGRTAVLVGLTGATALGGQWLARRGLGVGAESLTAVALGLLVLDLFGARRAGWLEAPADDWFVVVVGASLLAMSLGLCLPARPVVTAQLTAPVGLGVAALGLAVATMQWPATAAGAVLACACLVQLGRGLDAVVLLWTSATCGLIAFAGLVLLALAEAATSPTLDWLWLEGHGVWMLVVAVLVLLPWPMAPGRGEVRQLVAGLSASTLTFTAALPVFDEGPSALALAAVAGTVSWALVSAAAPPRWYAVPRVPLAGSALVLLPAPLLLAATALSNLVGVAPPFTADADVRLDPAEPLAHPLLLPLGVAVLVLATLLTLPRSRALLWTSGAALATGGVLGAALHPLPLWVFVVVLGPAGVLVSAPSAVLTLLVLGEITLLAAYVLVRRTGDAATVAGLVLPASLGGFLWTGGHVLGVPYDHVSLVALLVLGALALALPRLEVELVAGAAVLAGSVGGVPVASDPSVSLAVHLTLAGALVTASALVHRDHRPLAWLGGFLLAAATWVRLHDVGVQAPEAYTLPTALALVALGVHRLQRDIDADTSTLLPGLALATVPSLLWALADPVSPRAALLGTGCLVLLLGGAGLRWSAPVVVGGLVGAALVLRELAPYAAQTPQWVLIGTAGTLLIGTGITWEARLRDLRQAAGYLERLR
jgi:hypothetical protein